MVPKRRKENREKKDMLRNSESESEREREKNETNKTVLKTRIAYFLSQICFGMCIFSISIITTHVACVLHVSNYDIFSYSCMRVVVNVQRYMKSDLHFSFENDKVIKRSPCVCVRSRRHCPRMLSKVV